MRLWIGIGGLALGLILGVALGFAFDDASRLDSSDDEVGAGPVPDACLEAIAAARDRLLLNPEVIDTLRDYRDVGQDVTEAVSDLRLPDLRGTLERLNDLNDQAGELIERSVDARFSGNARECEDAAEQAGAASSS